MRSLFFLTLFCTAVQGFLPAGHHGGTDDFAAQWLSSLEHGLAAGQAGTGFLDQVRARFGPVVADAFRSACDVLPFLASSGALSWPGDAAGGDLDHYLRAEDLLGADRVERSLKLTARKIDASSAQFPRDMEGLVTDLEGLALLSRFHAYKVVAARNLALFQQSGDVATLRRAMWSAAAGLSLWARLSAMVTLRPGLLLGAGAAGNVIRAQRIARADLRLAEGTDAIFRRYGLFEAALIFAPEQGTSEQPAPLDTAWPQGRFRPLYPETSYSAARGYGWLRGQSIKRAGRAGLRGTAAAALVIDLPDGEYRVASLVANQPELASGSFEIRAGLQATVYEPGETGEKWLDARVAGGQLRITFVPRSGNDWVVTSVVAVRRRPHFGWRLPRAVESGGPVFIGPTITAPDGIKEAAMSCITPEERRLVVPLVRDDAQSGARIIWPARWSGKHVRCHFTAVDNRGTSARFPDSTDMVIELR